MYPSYANRIVMKPVFLCCISGLAITLSCLTGFAAEIVVNDHIARLRAGVLTREIHLDDAGLRTVCITVDGKSLLATPTRELVVRVRKAQPNMRPVGLQPGEGKAIDSVATFRADYKEDSSRWEDNRPNAVRWVEPVVVSSDGWSDSSAITKWVVEKPKPGVHRLAVQVATGEQLPSAQLDITLYYELYDGHPVVRKWVKIHNRSDRWLMLDRLVIDDIHVAEPFQYATPLTPVERGAESSVTALGNAEGSLGVIVASEVPSALRNIDKDGCMGYREELFEWVLGPGEAFISEPVFLYAYCGSVQKTPSAPSIPLDRTVEGSYMRFLRRHLGIGLDTTPLYAPQWMTWATFGPGINDSIVRSRAKLAARAGFAQILLDDGWQRDRLGTEPNEKKFSDFAATCRFIHEQGLSLGLWVSCYRNADSKDLQTMPDASVLPVVTRLKGKAMSFSSAWRNFYADDLAKLSDEWGVSYFKQDFSNIRFGDFAKGHEGRSMRDSLLRGLRGLLQAQDLIRAAAPDVINELTHEIYWGTPGVPCDIAALQHACQYHIPPNNCRGAYPYFKKPSIDINAHRKLLILGCYEARQRFYAHRGLPLHCLEYYGAATYSINGSLTPAIQDRQIVSFLMGAPLTFSGDLATLSDENIAHYRQRFDLLKRLQGQYDIYRRFQFSGAPAPTDTNWHWWGKLNDDGFGAVVVVRGSGGSGRREINIPWVKRDNHYRITACMAGVELGQFTGAQLQDSGVQISLPPLGQEILELAPISTK